MTENYIRCWKQNHKRKTRRHVKYCHHYHHYLLYIPVHCIPRNLEISLLDKKWARFPSSIPISFQVHIPINTQSALGGYDAESQTFLHTPAGGLCQTRVYRVLFLIEARWDGNGMEGHSRVFKCVVCTYFNIILRLRIFQRKNNRYNHAAELAYIKISVEFITRNGKWHSRWRQGQIAKSESEGDPMYPVRFKRSTELLKLKWIFLITK